MTGVSVNEKAEAWNKADSTLAAYAARRHIPLGGTFELTARCNLSCKMCYVRVDRSQFAPGQRELTAREWIRMGEDAAAAGTLNLLLTGGEPLLRPDFPEIYTALSHMGFIVTLYTNATLMTPELFKLFEKCPPTAVGVTLYGASPDTYARVCGSSDAFDRTLRGLEMLAALPSSLEVRSTFIRDNMDELDELRAIANRYTNRFAITLEVFKAIRGATADVASCRMTPKQMFDLGHRNADYYRVLNDVEQEFEDRSVVDVMQEGRDYGFDIPPAILACLAAKSMYWIAWDGKMLPCGSFSSPYTLPLEEGFVPAWNRLPTLFEQVHLPKKCHGCEYVKTGCPNCPATLQTESGEFDVASPYLCEIAAERARRKRPQ